MAVALLQAVEDCRYIQAKLLIEQGVNVNAKNTKGCTPLIMSLTIPDQQKRFKMFKWLLRQGADSGYIDVNCGRDLLSWAAYYNRTDQVSCILDVDEGLVNIHHQDKYGRSAMHYATMHNNVDALYMLVKHAAKYGLTVDIRDNDGLTPYLMTSMMGYDHCKQILVDIGRAVTSQVVMTFINLQKPKTVEDKPKVEHKLSKSMTHLNETNLPPLKSILKNSKTSKSQNLQPSSPKSNNSSSSSMPSIPSKKRNIPRMMDILSQQASQTYRPAARLPIVEVPSTKAVKKSGDKPALSLTTAVRITTMAASFRKRKQLAGKNS